MSNGADGTQRTRATAVDKPTPRGSRTVSGGRFAADAELESGGIGRRSSELSDCRGPPGGSSSPGTAKRVLSGAPFVLVLVLMLGTAAVCLGNAVSWINRPFAGFTFYHFPVAGSVGSYDWPGARAGIRYRDVILTVDGRAVSSGADIEEIIGRNPPGTIHRYLVDRQGTRLEFEVPVSTFTIKDFILVFLTTFVGGIIFWTIGAVVYSLKRNTSISWAFLLFCFFVGLYMVTGFQVQSTTNHFWYYVTLIAMSFFPAANLHLSLLFPDRLPVAQRWPTLQLAPYVLSLALATYLAMDVSSLAGVHGDLRKIVTVSSHMLTGIQLTRLYGVLGGLAIVGASAYAYRRSASVIAKQRAQLVFIGSALAFLPATVAMTLASLTKVLIPFNLLVFPLVAFPAAIGYAIAWRNLFDVDVYVKRALGYGVMTVIVATGYVSLQAVTTAFILAPVFGRQGERVYLVLFAVLVVLFFNPVERSVHRAIERLFFRKKSDYKETTHALSQALTSVLTLGEISRRVAETLQRELFIDTVGVITLEPEGQARPTLFAGHPAPPADIARDDALISLVVERKKLVTRVDVEEDPRLARVSEACKRTLERMRASMVLPLMYRGGAIGVLAVGYKESGQFFTREDIELLETMAHEAAAAMENSKLAERSMRITVLEEMDRLKTEFFANISHEFRTPITLSLGPLQQVLAGRHGPVADPVARQLRVVLANQERLLALINQILELARLEAGGMKLKATLIPDVNLFVKNRASQFQSIADDRGVELRFALDPQLAGAPLFLDLEKFDRLLVNLLSNAFKFTKQGHVDVTTRREDAAFHLCILDTGVGIRPHELPRVFDRFHQADGSESREYAGTGIGLALVKEIAMLHGGEVKAESEYGKGSAFLVIVPLGKAHLDSSSIMERTGDHFATFTDSRKVAVAPESVDRLQGVDELNREAELQSGGERPTILYAEDNPELRSHVRGRLEPDYRVLLAVDGRDGLVKARQYNPDLIISDQMMPQMSGRDLLRALRSDAQLQATPVIFLTARAGTEARIESLEAGADDYLAKPFHESELRARVRNLLTARAQEREIRSLNRKLTEWNTSLEERVREQVARLESLGRLRRFFSPQLADLIVSGGAEDPLKSHRREVAVVFLDLPRFTAFAETSDPEDVMGVLREYHAEMGKLILRHEGTLERFTGDGMMIFFNDPVPIPNPAERAVRMALEMRDHAGELILKWRRRGYDLHLGIGIDQGYATIGAIGFEGRWDYGAIGIVTNLASRLCAEARPGQILVSQRLLGRVEELVEAAAVGELTLKGFHRPVLAYQVVRLKGVSSS